MNYLSKAPATSSPAVLVQAASLRLLFGESREYSKPRRLFDKERPILRRVALVGRGLLIDFCKAAMLIGGHEHGGSSSLLIGPAITEKLAQMIKRVLGSIPNF